MSDKIIFELLNFKWERIDISTLAFDPQVDDELGSTQGSGRVSLPYDDPIIESIVHPDNQSEVEQRFRIWEDSELVFSGLLDTVTRDVDKVTVSGIQRGGELAAHNFGQRNLDGWWLRDVLFELRHTNVSKAPFATVKASNEKPETPALNAITGEWSSGSYWSIEYTGGRPSTFDTPEWIRVDLGSVKTIDAIRIVTEYGKRHWYQYRLQVKDVDPDDEFGWTTLEDTAVYSRPNGRLWPNAVTCRYIRVQMYASADGYPRVAQIVAYQQVAALGSETNYAVPWIEKPSLGTEEDAGNSEVISEPVLKEVTVGAMPTAADEGPQSGEQAILAVYAGGRLSHRFVGTSAAIYFSQDGPSTAEIFLDGVSQGQITIPADSSQHEGFTVSGLSDGPHTIDVLGITGSSGIDYFSGVWRTSWRSIDVAKGRNPYLSLIGLWGKRNNTQAVGGREAYSRQAGALLSMEFWGDRIQYIGSQGVHRGIYEFFIDGVSQGLVDAYRAIERHRQIIYQWEGTYGFHRLDVVNTGTKNAAALSANIDVDEIRGNFDHSLFLRSAYDTNAALLGRMSEMSNSFVRLNPDGTIDLLDAIGTDTGQVIREGKGESGVIVQANVEGDYSNTVSAILALGQGGDRHSLRVFVQDRRAVRRMGIKVAKVEARDIPDAYALVRYAWQILQESRFPRRNYTITYTDSDEVGPVRVGDLVRIYAPTYGLTGDKYRIVRKTTSWDVDAKTFTLEVANRRDRLSNLLTRASRNLSLTTDTPQGKLNIVQYGGATMNLRPEGGNEYKSALIPIFIADDSSVIERAALHFYIHNYRTETTTDIFDDGTPTGEWRISLDGIRIDELAGETIFASKDREWTLDLTGVLISPGWHMLKFRVLGGTARVTAYVTVQSYDLIQ